jgi:hypothetical protein
MESARIVMLCMRFRTCLNRIEPAVYKEVRVHYYLLLIKININRRSTEENLDVIGGILLTLNRFTGPVTGRGGP